MDKKHRVLGINWIFIYCWHVLAFINKLNSLSIYPSFAFYGVLASMGFIYISINTYHMESRVCLERMPKPTQRYYICKSLIKKKKKQSISEFGVQLVFPINYSVKPKTKIDWIAKQDKYMRFLFCSVESIPQWCSASDRWGTVWRQTAIPSKRQLSLNQSFVLWLWLSAEKIWQQIDRRIWRTVSALMRSDMSLKMGDNCIVISLIEWRIIMRSQKEFIQLNYGISCWCSLPHHWCKP